MNDKKIIFADLFAGIGGFHTALKNISKTNDFKIECAYVSEIDSYAKKTYSLNYNFILEKMYDVRELSNHTDPNVNLDVVFCGFPCQPFSSAGKQEGFNDENRGTLIFDVIKFVKKTNPKSILLENVKHLVQHNNRETLTKIIEEFQNIGYELVCEQPIIISPHELEIPQKRYRVFMPFIKKELLTKKHKEKMNKLTIDEFKKNFLKENNNIVDEEVNEEYFLSDELNRILKAWEEFVSHYQKQEKRIPVFYIDDVVFKQKDKVKYENYEWYKKYYDSMNKFYLEDKNWIDDWTKKWNVNKWKNKIYRKLEWQAGNNNFNDAFLQIRQSGLRFRKNDIFPTLVAMVQTSIIYSHKEKKWRKLTPKEISRLQSFPEDFIICENEHQACKQFGNSVNVKVVEYVIRNYLLDFLLEDK